MRQIPSVLCCAAVLLLASGASAPRAQSADSLAYTELRAKASAIVTERPGLQEAIEAADDLARDRFFDVAFDLLDETMAAPADSSTESVTDTSRAPPSSKPRPVEWVVSASGDYNSTQDSSSYDTLYRDSSVIIDDRYYSGKLQASMIWRPGVADIQRITPTVYISESRLHGDLKLDAASPKRFLTGRVGVVGEKRLLQDYGDSSDMVQIFEGVNITTRPAGKPLSLSLPVDGEAAWFRIDRPGYASYVDARARPELELAGDSLDASASLFFEAEYRNYAPAGDSADRWSYCPGLAADYFGGSGWVTFQGGYEVGRYPNSGSPAREQRIDVDLAASLKSAENVEVSLGATVTNEKSSFHDSVSIEYDTAYVLSDTTQAADTFLVPKPVVVQAPYALGGWEFSLAPALEIGLGRGFSVRCALSTDFKRYPLLHYLPDGRHLNQPLYLWESLDAYEPGLSLEYSSERVLAKLGGSYRIEEIKDQPTYFLKDSRTWRANGALQWTIVSWLTVDAFVEYQSKTEKTGESSSPAWSSPASAVSVSLSLEARF